MRIQNQWLARSAGVVGMAWMMGCAHTRPEEMSVEEHRVEALSHYRNAATEEAQYDPKADPHMRPSPLTPGPAAPAGMNAPSTEYWVYNPTEFHLADAARERAHAEEHTRAAMALETGEAKECAGIAPEARGSCPLLGPYVQTLEETARGAVLHLKAGAPAASIAQHMRCQLAYARVKGFEKPRVCPLYSRGEDILLGKDGSSIELRGDGVAAAADIRAHLRAQLGRGVPAQAQAENKP